MPLRSSVGRAGSGLISVYFFQQRREERDRQAGRQAARGSERQRGRLHRRGISTLTAPHCACIVWWVVRWCLPCRFCNDKPPPDAEAPLVP